jgi:LuxR family maltose regulon positive regulatory protein
MTISLLQTKLFVPSPWTALIPRPRLIRRLDERRRLTLVSAPAGFGKTTLVGAWAKALASNSPPPEKVAWLSLDAADDDPVRFWSYAIAALQTVHPNIGKTALAMLHTPQPPRAETVLASLLNEATALSERVALVLDDYHLIRSRMIHQALTFLIDHLPSQLRLVILTRADPPLPLARLRVRGQLIELRAADLRFTTTETAAFLGQAMGLDLGVDDITALEGRTEGWIAALQLAAIAARSLSSTQDRSEVQRFVSALTGSHHYIADFLVQEVLDRQPVRVREFLLKTSILERLSGPLCDALTGHSDGQATLEALEQANLFVVPLDHQRHWYRYHHLFADMLRGQLHRISPDQVLKLQQRASEWHELQGSLEEAIPYALAGQDFGRATALIQQYAPTMLAEGRVAGLSTWIDALPADALAAHPELELAHIWSLFFEFELEQMKARLERIEQHLTAETSISVRGELALLRGVMARLDGQVDRSIVLFRHALEQLPSTDALLRGRSWLHLGLAHLNTDMDQAEQALSQACADFETAASMHGLLAAYYFLTSIQMMCGALHRAAATCRKALLAAELSRHLPAAGYAYVAMGEVLYERNDLERALSYLTQGAELAERGGHAETLVKAALALARCHRARGEWTAAQQRIDQFDQAARHMPPSAFPLHPVIDEQVQLWLAQGQVRKAIGCFCVATEACAHIPAQLRLVHQLVRARLDVVQNRSADALLLLDPILQTAQSAGMVRLVLQALSLRALALYADGRPDRAIDTLGRALEMADPGGYVRTFVDEGRGMLPLLHSFRRRCQNDRLREYADRLIASFGPAPTSELVETLPLSENRSLIEPLSERELQVLRLLAEGKSNREIGDALFIAVGTVKKHLSNIFGKIGVQNRTQCAAQARELGLV